MVNVIAEDLKIWFNQKGNGWQNAAGIRLVKFEEMGNRLLQSKT
jgi:hypothetical protein